MALIAQKIHDQFIKNRSRSPCLKRRLHIHGYHSHTTAHLDHHCSSCRFCRRTHRPSACARWDHRCRYSRVTRHFYRCWTLPLSYRGRAIPGRRTDHQLHHCGSHSGCDMERVCVPSCPTLLFALLSAWQLRSSSTASLVLVLLICYHFLRRRTRCSIYSLFWQMVSPSNWVTMYGRSVSTLSFT